MISFTFLIKGVRSTKTCVYVKNNTQTILRTNAWKVIELIFKVMPTFLSEALRFFCTTLLLLILPWHWRSSWRRDAWWTGTTHGIQLNIHRPTLSIPWSKYRPQRKKLLGRRQHHREHNCQINVVFWKPSKTFCSTVMKIQKTALQSRGIVVIEHKAFYLSFMCVCSYRAIL